MAAIDEPFNIANGDPGDADAVMANFNTIVNAINGGLELGSNVKAAAPSAAIMGNTSSPGTSVSALRADAQFTIQGFENSSSDPASSNFVGRMYYNTVNSQTRMCIATAGSGTWVSVGNPLATELVVHAAQHKDGAHDPLADNTLTDHMFAAKTNLFTATIAADVSDISGSGYTTLIDNFSVTTTGAQTVAFTIALRFKNNTAFVRTVGYRVVDVTASSTTIFASNREIIAVSGAADQQVFSSTFFYTTPVAGGVRQFRLGAGADSAAGGGVDVVKGTSFNSETLVPFTIQAVIV